MLSHYDAAAAMRQKVGALAGRPETQARDVFDLHNLLAVGTNAAGLAALDARVVTRATANALSVGPPHRVGQAADTRGPEAGCPARTAAQR
jgi:hypothetical protein